MDNTTATIGSRKTNDDVSLFLELVHCPATMFAGGTVWELRGTVTLGRSPGPGGIKIEDTGASREHLRITSHKTHGVWELEDLGSKNGTFVNGFSTSRKFLEAGDVIRAGDSVFLARNTSVPAPDSDPYPAMIGRSEAVLEIKSLLPRMATGRLPVLVLGETGTGKELIARAVHKLSGRPGRCVAVNCAAIPDNLFESTFFGHRKGAFSGATADSSGLLFDANNGTLFLDEVGEMPQPTQAKLLRFLEDGLVRPLGATVEKKVDVRVVAATNALLAKMQGSGRFRSDLLNRLQGHIVALPPLRERREDIPALLCAVLSLAGMAPFAFEANLLEALLTYDWPGNVRELRTLVLRWSEGAVPVRRDDGIFVLTDDLLDQCPAKMANQVRNRRNAPEPPSLRKRGRPGKEELLEVLARFRGAIADVARHYGKDRKQIYRWMERYDIELEE